MANEIKKVKDDLIAEIDKRIADKIIEKTNADLLKKLITSAETINEAIMIAELGTTYKRTGFHFDKRLEKMTDTIKYFKKNKKLSFVQDKNALTHKLIIGDNYDALLNLLIEYRGKIDVIYIDPPYGKDSMGEFAQTNYDNAITRDNLLSMLYPRLVLARQLLSDNGVIFCSIDDKNQAYTKGLFDEVFGESNFVSNLVWQKKTGASDATAIATTTEYILMYAGNLEKLLLTKNIESYDINRYRFIDEYENERGPYYIDNLDRGGLQYSDSMNYGIECPDGTVAFPNGRTEFKNDGWIWKWSKEKVDWARKNNFIEFRKSKSKKSGWAVCYKNYLNVDNENGKIERSAPHKNLIQNILNANGATEMKDIFGDNTLFKNVKPVELIKTLISIPNPAIILDFFAGSGTTGQAVLELNKQDGGKRQFILATANEITNTTPNGIVNDVTGKRLKRVMMGECYDGTKDFKWNEKNKPLGDNLDVFDIATVANFESTKDKTPFDMIDETLYGKEKLGVKEKIKWVCENFEGTQKTLEDK